MPAKIRHSFKIWMIVYVAFALALTAANMGSNGDFGATAVSPGSMPAIIPVERTFFRSTIDQPRRSDI